MLTSPFAGNRSYLKVFLYLSIIFMVFFIPFSVFLMNQSVNYALYSMNKLNEEKLDRAIENTEFILRKIKNYGVLMYEDQDVQRWINEEEKSPLTQTMAVSKISKYVSAEPFISSVYLVNIKTKQIYDSRFGLFSFEDFYDQGMIKTITYERPQFLRVYNRNLENVNYFDYINRYMETDSYLYIIIPSTPVNFKYNGYLVVLLNKSILSRYLSDSTDSVQDSGLVFLDDKGDLVLSNVSQEEFYSFIENNKNKIDNKKSIEADGHQVFISKGKLPTEQWDVFYISNMKDFKSSMDNFKKRIILCGFAVLLAIIAVLYWNSLKTYKPYSALAEDLQSKLSIREIECNSEKTKSEYDIIKKAVEMLMDNVDNLNSYVRKQENILKTEYLSQWILQGTMSDQVKDFISNNSDLLTYKFLYIAVLRIESYRIFCEKNNFSSRKIIKYAMGNISEELLKNKGFFCHHVDMGSDHIVLLIGKNEQDATLLKKVLSEASNEIKKWIDVKVSIGVSSPTSMDADIKNIYNKVYELTMLKFLYGDDKIYDESDLTVSSANVNCEFFGDIVDKIVQEVRLGHKSRVHELCDKFIDTVRNMDHEECKLRLTVFTYSVIRTFNKITNFENVNNIRQFIDEFSTVDDFCEWLKDELSYYIDTMASEKNTSKKTEIVMEVIEYVKTHLHDPNLTIEEIAEHVSLSAGYVRQIFKEPQGDTLSDFILKERINKAKNLLATTESSVLEISERAGFQTKSHFYSAFKKTTGFTPSQYRQEFKKNELFNET